MMKTLKVGVLGVAMGLVGALVLSAQEAQAGGAGTVNPNLSCYDACQNNYDVCVLLRKSSCSITLAACRLTCK